MSVKIKNSLSKADKTIVYFVISVPIIFIICVVIYHSTWSDNAGTTILKESEALVFDGRIDSVYRDSNNHNIKTVILQNGSMYRVYAEWEAFIEKGDSLSKSSGSLDVVVYKKNKVKIILNYMKLAKTRKWEL